VKTPLAEVFFFLHGNGARKFLMLAVRLMFAVQLGTPRGRYDEYSSKVFPQLRNQGMSIRRGRSKYN
jgi:hypothetical protein